MFAKFNYYQAINHCNILFRNILLLQNNKTNDHYLLGAGTVDLCHKIYF